MQLKTNLHFHTKEDKFHHINYNALEGIDIASKLGFEILAITCHQKLIFSEDLKKYAESKNILLISGIEISISENNRGGRHLIILNCDSSAEEIKTFKDLEKYKELNPNTFIVAPHPYFPVPGLKQSLLEYTEKYLHLFDAIEHSWFYSDTINKNIEAEKLARKNDLPFIATSDTHFINYLNTDYCLVESKEKTINDVFRAIKNKSFKNITRPKKIFSEMLFPQISFTIKDRYLHIKNYSIHPKNKIKSDNEH